MERDLNWCCSNDDMRAVEENYTTRAFGGVCPDGLITDYRPLIRDLVDGGFGFLVFSGDVDAQLPHTGTEAWTTQLGFREVAAWQPWLATPPFISTGTQV